ncbi:MAG TPA: ribosome maturation factor RimP [Acidobacteriaceae bacterium]|nr:ribosome maturation factor RimP [Acidobacteriaceae bacterium]
MALQLDQLRAVAERVAASHKLELVDIEFQGAGKFRTLRIYIEKNAAERAKLVAAAESGDAELPSGVPAELLSGTTHEDCANFATDFGTLLDVEDLVPGAEYTLEVSSPGLERKLFKAVDYERFVSSLVKIQTFTPIDGNRHWTGRLVGFKNGAATLDLSAVKQKGKAKKAAGKKNESQTVEIPLVNIEKANLVAEV